MINVSCGSSVLVGGISNRMHKYALTNWSVLHPLMLTTVMPIYIFYSTTKIYSFVQAEWLRQIKSSKKTFKPDGRLPYLCPRLGKGYFRSSCNTAKGKTLPQHHEGYTVTCVYTQAGKTIETPFYLLKCKHTWQYPSCSLASSPYCTIA